MANDQQEQNDFYYPDLVIGIEDDDTREPLLRMPFIGGKYFVCIECCTLRLKYTSVESASRFIFAYLQHRLSDRDQSMKIVVALKNGAKLWEDEGVVLQEAYDKRQLTFEKIKGLIKLIPISFIEKDEA